MFIAATSASLARFVSIEQLLDDAGQELNACLPLPRGDERRTADLVEHRGGALLVRRIDDVRLQRIDGGQLVLPSVEAKLTRIVGRRDGRGVGHVQRGEPRRHDAASGGREPRPAEPARPPPDDSRPGRRRPQGRQRSGRRCTPARTGSRRRACASAADPRSAYFARLVNRLRRCAIRRSWLCCCRSVSSRNSFTAAVAVFLAVTAGSKTADLRGALDRQSDAQSQERAGRGA